MEKSHIKMRVNNNRETNCFFCGCSWKNTSEMYDIAIGHKKTKVLQICRPCVNELFVKTLKAERHYDSRVKSQLDLKRAANESIRLYGEVGKRLSEVPEPKGEE